MAILGYFHGERNSRSHPDMFPPQSPTYPGPTMNPTEISEVIRAALRQRWPQNPDTMANRIEAALNYVIGSNMPDIRADSDELVEYVWVHYGPGVRKIKVEVIFKNNQRFTMDWTERAQFELAA